jgi:hypothetical protein
MQQCKKSFTRGSLLVLFCLSGASTARAYRPFDGTDADVAELGEFELELGPAQLLHEDGRNFLISPTVLNLGILPRTELVVDLMGSAPLRPLPASFGVRGEPRYAIRDTDVFLKFLLRKGSLQEETGLSVAFEGGALIPEIYGEQGYGASGNLIISQQWGWFVVHLNNELEFARSTGDPVWANNLINEFRISESFRPVTELTWERDIKARVNAFAGLVGFIWSVAEDFDIDGAAVVVTSEGQQAIEGRLGLTWAFAIYEPQKVSPAEEEKNGGEHLGEDMDAPAEEDEKHAAATTSTKQRARR